MQDDPVRSAFEPPMQALPPQVGHPSGVPSIQLAALPCTVALLNRSVTCTFMCHHSVLIPDLLNIISACIVNSNNQRRVLHAGHATDKVHTSHSLYDLYTKA